MNKNVFTCLAVVVAVLLGITSSTLAGPSLPVTKPPVEPGGLLTGPMIDMAALQGQWFVNTNFTVQSVCTNEFHDNVTGGPAGANAITGYVDSIIYSGAPGTTPIIAFTIQATIFNDAIRDVSWSSGSNRHGETQTNQVTPYVGPLLGTKLVAEFAIAGTNRLPAVFPPASPYVDRQPYIVAVNEDHWAWYCWNPSDPNQAHQPSGDFYVPTWDFGTIPFGQSSTRKLSFTVLGGLPPGDSRYPVIEQSFATGSDVLQNRTLSLKISTWIDEIALDTGAQQEEPPARLSDVSVFHNVAATMDFGDAPDSPYPTYLANDGARHIVVPGIYMGSLIDMEADGQPTPSADGDDKNPPTGMNDEDGVVFLGALIAGQSTTVQVTVSTSGYINAWIDFNANGSWADAGDQFLTMSFVPAAGTYNFGVPVPLAAETTNTFARFRFATPQTPLSYTGSAPNGEVEDYEVTIFAAGEERLDFGDAWDGVMFVGYPTLLANNGARHTVVPGVFLGARIDAEFDGQPTPSADGDDNNPPAGMDDEDGVTLPAVLMAGSTAQVQVVASVAGYLNAWIDFNASGTWVDAGEQCFVNVPLVPGVNTLSLLIPPPPATVAGGPHSRWRFTTYPPVTPTYTGAETNGEVEDYEVQLEVLDFGDAPDRTYPTLLASDGARHRIPSAYWLGVNAPDSEPDGLPTATADGDDNTGIDDEDGVFVPGALVQGGSGLLGVIASTTGYLNAWMDFNNDGDWSDSGEQIATGLSLPAGVNPLSFTVPGDAQLGPTFGRFRFSSARGLGITGLATDGEVEDHPFTIYQNGPDTNNFRITNIVHTATNEMTIWWSWESNVTYEAQYTTNLLTTDIPPWTAWGGYVIGPTNVQTDTNAAERLRYYRVVAPYSPPPP